MYECTAATIAAGVHGQFKRGALRIFFNKLCNFCKELQPLFLFWMETGIPVLNVGQKSSTRRYGGQMMPLSSLTVLVFITTR